MTTLRKLFDPRCCTSVGQFLRYRQTLSCACVATHKVPIRLKSNNVDSSLFVPLPIRRTSDNEEIASIGEELTKPLERGEVQNLLNQFVKRSEILQLSEQNGLDRRLFNQAFASFRRYCMDVNKLPPDIHIIFNDILQDAGHVDDLFPYFLRHAQTVFPHLNCMDDLKKISDLRLPANWYPEARMMNRKIIMHVGPTNSGKTYHALERFIGAKSGVYCGPLKLLASEVYMKTNEKGTPCDLVTGEERLYANDNKSASTHVACTVEMASVACKYEVAVIDEIQMMRDPGRGWAWTRALLGVAAEEIHLCGEGTSVDLVKELCEQIGEEVEVRQYKRLTAIQLEDAALGSLERVQPGDCIVCFNKADIYNVSRKIEQLGHQCAVIYGGLPPGTKLAQAKKFNDPNDPCKILVATDAVGMGLNLSIRRVIFYSLIKPTLNEKGEREMEHISTSQALQIGGRAGRYGTQFAEGRVTTFKAEDLPTLKAIWEREVPPIEAAGLHPTADQIELFAYHLPQATLSNLMDIFVSLCQVDDSNYFMCVVEDFKFLADLIQHVPLPLRARYVFCCAPINKKFPFVCNMFLKFARQYSRNQPITYDWLCQNIHWPLGTPSTIAELIHLEAVFDVLDCYLWLSYRFTDLFPNVDSVRDMQKELDNIIQLGVVQITTLLKNSEMKGVSVSDEESTETENKKTSPEKRSTKDKESATTYSSSRTKIRDMTTPKVEQANEMTAKVGGGRLADRLVAQGLLTATELEQLQAEWQKQMKIGTPGKAPSPSKPRKTSSGVKLTKVAAKKPTDKSRKKR